MPAFHREAENGMSERLLLTLEGPLPEEEKKGKAE